GRELERSGGSRPGARKSEPTRQRQDRSRRTTRLRSSSLWRSTLGRWRKLQRPDARTTAGKIPALQTSSRQKTGVSRLKSRIQKQGFHTRMMPKAFQLQVSAPRTSSNFLSTAPATSSSLRKKTRPRRTPVLRTYGNW